VPDRSARRRPRVRVGGGARAKSRLRPGAPAAVRRERVVEITKALGIARTAEDVMSVLVLEAEEVFGAASSVAYLRSGDSLELVAAMGRAEDAHEWLRRVPLGAHIPVARAVREGRSGWYESRAALAAAFPGWAERVPHAERFGALAALALRRGEAVLGAVGLAFDVERPFLPEERGHLETVATEGAIALERVGLVEGPPSPKGP
jgi:GAF domain-containing protein